MKSLLKFILPLALVGTPMLAVLNVVGENGKKETVSIYNIINDLKTTIDQLEEKKQAIDIKIEDIKENIKKLQDAYEANKTKIAKLELELEDLKAEKEKNSKEIRTLKSRIEILGNKIGEIQDILEKFKDKHKELKY
ncbi:MAG: hypothetical protein REH79_00060 [Spiroplasma sp.]|nr:hypothetical protein [Spiroplasma sp.]